MVPEVNAFTYKEEAEIFSPGFRLFVITEIVSDEILINESDFE